MCPGACALEGAIGAVLRFGMELFAMFNPLDSVVSLTSRDRDMEALCGYVDRLLLLFHSTAFSTGRERDTIVEHTRGNNYRIGGWNCVIKRVVRVRDDTNEAYSLLITTRARGRRGFVGPPLKYTVHTL